MPPTILADFGNVVLLAPVEIDSQGTLLVAELPLPTPRPSRSKRAPTCWVIGWWT